LPKSFSWHGTDLGVAPTKVRNLFLELVDSGVLRRPTRVRTKAGHSQVAVKPKIGRAK
jgi:hypothetical protein